MEKKKEIQHFLHHHPLYLVQDQEDYDKKDLVCTGCRELLAYPSYGCEICGFYLHDSCSQIQRDLQHHFHPCPLTLTKERRYRCNACFVLHGPGFSFCCMKCDFDLDLKCALEPTTEKSDQDDGEIQHFTHRHPLQVAVPIPNKEICCSICKKQLCSEEDVTYGCNICKDFFLHHSCMMSIPRKIDQHPFHPEHPLILLTTPSYKCEGCDKKGSGLAYRCGLCNVKLDVECALLPTASCESAKQIQHFSHPHPLDDHLMILGRSSTKLQPRCSICRQQSSPTPPDFGCNRHGCNFYLHRSCAMEFTQTIQGHHFHPNHSLKFDQIVVKSNYSWCKACWKDFELSEWVYSCGDCSNFQMHLSCSKLTPSFCCGNHQHLFTLFEEGDEARACVFCNDYCTAFFLRCVACDINFHIQCHPLAPKTVRHKYHHWHDLTLTASPLDYEVEDYGILDEYYCDFCEEPRPASNPVYCCTKCNLSADIRCIISQVLPSLNEKGQSSTTGEKGSTSTDPELEKFTRYIKVLKTDFQQKESERLELKAKVQELKSQLQAHEKELQQVTGDVSGLEWNIQGLEGTIFKINAKKLYN